LTSERVAKLGWAEEVFYRRLMSVVDDFGRYYATPMLIRAACYPLLIDKVSDADVGKWLAKCAEAALVSVYPAPDGKRYLQMLDFRQQVRASASKFPPMPDGCVADAQQMHSNGIADAKPLQSFAHLDVDVSVDVDGGGKRPRKARATPLPDGFAVSQRVTDWAKEKGHTLLEKRLEHFVGYARRSGKTYVDWDEAFMSAIREDWAKLGAATAPTEAPAVQPGGWQ
jgi:hypothetical protein